MKKTTKIYSTRVVKNTFLSFCAILLSGCAMLETAWRPQRYFVFMGETSVVDESKPFYRTRYWDFGFDDDANFVVREHLAENNTTVHGVSYCVRDGEKYPFEIVRNSVSLSGYMLVSAKGVPKSKRPTVSLTMDITHKFGEIQFHSAITNQVIEIGSVSDLYPPPVTLTYVHPLTYVYHVPFNDVLIFISPIED